MTNHVYIISIQCVRVSSSWSALKLFAWKNHQHLNHRIIISEMRYGEQANNGIVVNMYLMKKFNKSVSDFRLSQQSKVECIITFKIDSCWRASQYVYTFSMRSFMNYCCIERKKDSIGEIQINMIWYYCATDDVCLAIVSIQEDKSNIICTIMFIW